MRIFKKSTKEKIDSYGETFIKTKIKVLIKKTPTFIHVEISHQSQGGKLRRHRQCRIVHKVRTTVKG